MAKEDQLQQACVKWFKLAYPGKLIIHVPNGGKRNIREAAKFKTMGVLSGIPDLLIFEPSNLHPGLAIELKAGKNKSTPSQLDIQQKLTERCWMVREVNSIDQFMATVNYYFELITNHAKIRKKCREKNLG